MALCFPLRTKLPEQPIINQLMQLNDFICPLLLISSTEAWLIRHNIHVLSAVNAGGWAYGKTHNLISLVMLTSKGLRPSMQPMAWASQPKSNSDSYLVILEWAQNDKHKPQERNSSASMFMRTLARREWRKTMNYVTEWFWKMIFLRIIFSYSFQWPGWHN